MCLQKSSLDVIITLNFWLFGRSCDEFLHPKEQFQSKIEICFINFLPNFPQVLLYQLYSIEILKNIQVSREQDIWSNILKLQINEFLVAWSVKIINLLEIKIYSHGKKLRCPGTKFRRLSHQVGVVLRFWFCSK